MMPRAQWLTGIPVDWSAMSSARTAKLGSQLNGPERGVCTSGRGLIDAIEERQL